MAKERRTVKEIRDAAKEHIDARIKSIELAQQEFQTMQNITDVERQRYNSMLETQKERIQLEAYQNELAKDYNKLTTQQKKAMDDTIKKHREALQASEQELGIIQQQNRELQQQKGWYDKIKGSVSELNKFIGGSSIWKFFMEADKGIKKTVLQLGLSGERADILRFNIEQSAQYAARMGVSVNELAEAQANYVEESGRALLLNEASLDAIIQMGKSTNMGIQNATKLAAQYELIGINATSAADKVLSIVDQSERMGVSATKMLKKVSDNFEAINKFAFRDGVDSFSKMAMYAERFKVDMGSMLDSAERARTLEGAVELAAQLQVMGGEFARTDPFELLFLSRNDPEKYQQKINNMTKGIAQFRKTADGTFEAYISPMDLDRLERAGAALGLTREEMAKQAKQMLKMQKISANLMGTGISKEDREMIAGMAEFNSKTGEYFVNLKGASMSIASIGKQHLSTLKKQNEDLNDRALAAQTFDDAWNNTISEFKATLLPMVKGINEALQDARPFISKALDWFGKFMKGLDGFMVKAGFVVAGLVAGGRLISGAVSKLMNLKNAITLLGGVGGGRTNGPVGSVVKTTTGTAGGAAANTGAGMGMLRGGAGVGAAALGIGAGIGAAALGIAELAKSMKDLDGTQIWALPATVLGIAGAMWALVPAISAAGAAGSVGAVGLLAIGGAFALIGTGIGVAAAGIGYMSKGIATLGDPVVADNLGKTASGVAQLMGAFSGGIFTGGLTGMLQGISKFATMSLAIRDMAAHSAGMKDIGNSFKNISAVMNGDPSQLEKIKNSIQAISQIDTTSNSALGTLTKLLSQPLTVKFADDKIAIKVDATLELDGDVLYKKVVLGRSNIQYENDARGGKATEKPTV
jgi:hypothetical protein